MQDTFLGLEKILSISTTYALIEKRGISQQ